MVERRHALFIADHGTLAHNELLLERLRARYDLGVREHSATRFAGRRELAAREVGLVAALLASPATYRTRVFLAASGHWAALAVARLLARRVVLFNFYLHELGRKSAVRRLLGFLLTSRVLVLAQSETDRDYFDGLGGRARVVVVVYGQDPVEGVSEDDVTLGDYVFSGGHTNRDYDALVRCARRLPEIPFVIVGSRATVIREQLPPNVTLERELPMPEFHRRLAAARLVAIPLAEDVGSSGQMVALAAMQLGKAVVAPDSPVVSQYVGDGAGFLYELGSEESLCASIELAYRDTDALARRGAAAREGYYARFTRAGFVDGVLAALEEAGL